MRAAHRIAVVMAMVGAVVIAGADLLPAQTPATSASVTGTVKTATDTGIVIVGRESGNAQREWAFAIDADTRIVAGGQTRPVTALKEGDSVTVSYANRDGKVVAQRVTVNPR